MAWKINWEGHELESGPYVEKLLRKMKILHDPQIVTEEDFMRACVLGISTSPDRIMIDTDRSGSLIDQPLSTIRCKVRGMIMPLLGFGSFVSPASCKQDNTVTQGPFESFREKFCRNGSISFRIAQVAKSCCADKGLQWNLVDCFTSRNLVQRSIKMTCGMDGEIEFLHMPSIPFMSGDDRGSNGPMNWTIGTPVEERLGKINQAHEVRGMGKQHLS